MDAVEGGQFDLYLNALRTFFWAFQFQSWDDFLLFVITHAKGRLKVKPLPRPPVPNDTCGYPFLQSKLQRDGAIVYG
jgi:hypothetical protein